MLKIRFRKQFRKDYKRVIKQPGHTPELFQEVLDCLVTVSYTHLRAHET